MNDKFNIVSSLGMLARILVNSRPSGYYFTTTLISFTTSPPPPCSLSAANMPYYVAMATAPEYITVNTAPFEIQYSRFIDSSGPHALLILLLRDAKSVKF